MNFLIRYHALEAVCSTVSGIPLARFELCIAFGIPALIFFVTRMTCVVRLLAANVNSLYVL